jgi:hypothetical protein
MKKKWSASKCWIPKWRNKNNLTNDNMIENSEVTNGGKNNNETKIDEN